MHDIVVFIPRDCETAEIEKSAAELLMYIKTNDIQNAAITIVPPGIVTANAEPYQNAELFCAHIMSNMPAVPVTIYNSKEKESNMTIQELAEAMVLIEQKEVNKLIHNFQKAPDITAPEICYQPDIRSYIYKKYDKQIQLAHANHALKQFNIVKQKRFIFNRTHNK